MTAKLWDVIHLNYIGLEFCIFRTPNKGRHPCNEVWLASSQNFLKYNIPLTVAA